MAKACALREAQPLDHLHGAKQPFAVLARQRAQHQPDVILRCPLKLGEGGAALGGQAELVLSPV